MLSSQSPMAAPLTPAGVGLSAAQLATGLGPAMSPSRVAPHPSSLYKSASPLVAPTRSTSDPDVGPPRMRAPRWRRSLIVLSATISLQQRSQRLPIPSVLRSRVRRLLHLTQRAPLGETSLVRLERSPTSSTPCHSPTRRGPAAAALCPTVIMSASESHLSVNTPLGA